MRGVPRERQCDLLGGIVVDLDAENACRAAHDRAELAGLVVPEPERHPEAVAQRRRQQARPRGGADEREGRQIDRQRAGGGSLAEDDVEPEVLERRVEDLLGGPVEAVDLVDEEHVARLDRGEDRGDVLLLERGAGDRAEADAELLAHDLRQRRLPEAGRAREQDVVERLAAPLGRVERDLPSCSLIRSWPTKSSSRRGRSERSTSSSSGSSTAVVTRSLTQTAQQRAGWARRRLRQPGVHSDKRRSALRLTPG